MSTHRPRVIVKDDALVTPLELFFDLVFVYALTQVTALVAAHLDAIGLVRGAIVLALVWWCWAGYSWLGNVIRADEGATRAAFIAVMAAMFVASLAIPEAFEDLPGGLSGPMVLAACYAVIRYVHLGIFWYTARSSGDTGLASTLLRFGSVATVSVVLLIVGAQMDAAARTWLWGAAVLVDYAGTQMIGAGGWRLFAPKHFSERHGLIIIIAIGESIVSIGVGASDLPVSASLVVAASVGIVLCAMLWWIYFDVTAIAAEHRLAETEGATRTALARDAYTFIHLPMVAGIILMALGLKKALAYIGGADGHSWHDALHGLPLWALHLGPALYLMSLAAFRYRIIKTVGESRPITAALLVASAFAGSHMPVMWDLAIVTAILVGLVAFEAIMFYETRERVRHGHHDG